MSSYNYKSQTYRYQLKSGVDNRFSVPLKSHGSTISKIKVGRFSTQGDSKIGQNSEEFLCYLYNYVFQEHPDDTNTVFYDSNLRKYRTRSSMRKEGENLLSKSYNKKYNFNMSKKASNYPVNRKTFADNKSDKMNLSQSNNITLINQRGNQTTESKFANKSYNQSSNIKRKNSEERAKIFRELKKEKDELLAEINNSSGKKNRSNANEEKSFNKQNKRENINNNTNINSFKIQEKSGNIKNLKGSDATRNQNNSKQEIKKKEVVTKNEISRTQINQKMNLGGPLKDSKQGNTNYQKGNSQKKEEINPIKNSKQSLPQSKDSQYSKSQLKQQINDKSTIKDSNNAQKNLEKKQDKANSKFTNQGFSNSQNINQNNQNQEEQKESNISIVKKHEEKTIVLIPGQTIEPRNKVEQFGNPIEEIIENPDGTRTSLIKQTKITTTTENVPIEEHKVKSLEGAPELPMVKQYITYEYKTITSIKDDDKDGQDANRTNSLRNSKLKNIGSPVKYDSQGNNQLEERISGSGNKGISKFSGMKINNNQENEKKGGDKEEYLIGNNNEGQYKKENLREGRNNNNENNKFENQQDNKNDITQSGQKNKKKDAFGNKLTSEEKDGRKDINYKGGNKNLNKETDLRNENNMNDENNEENQDMKNNFTTDVLPKGFQNEEEVENFLDEINKKGNNASPEEKEKRLKCIEDIFSNICKGGKNSETNIAKLAELLGKMNEKDRQEILSKLSKDFPKNASLVKNLLNSIQKQSLKKSTLKGKEKLSGNLLQKSGKKVSKEGELFSKIEKKSSKEGEFKSAKKSARGEENELLAKSGKYGDNGFIKGYSGSKEGIDSGLKAKLSEAVEVKEINQLKFDGLFLEISKYTNEHREKNPFEGPSPYTKFYKERRIKIQKKLHNMASGEIENEENEEKKLENEK